MDIPHTHIESLRGTWAHSKKVAISKPEERPSRSVLMASSKLTQPVLFSSHQLCGFLCHLPEPASYPLGLCVFGDIWHLKESEAKVGMAKIHSKECHIGLPLQTLRINNGQAALTPGELWGVYGVSRKLLAASQLSFPTRRAESHCLAFCRHVICPHMSHSWEADASPS